MPSVHLDDIPPDSDDIGQSAVIGHLLATAIEQMDQPLQIADRVRIQPGIAFRNPKNGCLIPGKDVDGRKVVEIRYIHDLKVENRHLVVMGWHIKLEGFGDIFFPADRFDKTE